MENKTAVEWLYENLEFNESISNNEIEYMFKQAKEMEKMQIIDAYSIGSINGEMIERDLNPKYTNPIQYYNETFKTE